MNPNLKHRDTGSTALHVAVHRKLLNMVRLLLKTFDGEIDVNAQDSFGNTALLLASKTGQVEVVSILCDESAIDPLTTFNGKSMLNENLLL